jgi:pSer/pThr/pTyr-binding forkhead associated (FHA) protein/energy-coupling factor transporter ATP-binding protein EcfA2
VSDTDIQVNNKDGVQQGIVGAGVVYVGTLNFSSPSNPAVAEQAGDDGAPAPPCPYPGLAYFGPEEADRFYGRDAVIERLAEAINRQSFTALIGASGAGKSSVVLAGLAPHLERTGNWRYERFRIGDELDHDPFMALARSLVSLLNESDSSIKRLERVSELSESLQAGKLTLRDVFADYRSRIKAKRILLIADQFEEVFTLVAGEELRRKFIDTLLNGFSDPASGADSEISLILTLRADFSEQALLYGLRDALQDHVVYLGAMKRGELREAIERPVEGANVSFESGLVETLLDDVENNPGGLPLLQFALREMWARQEKRTITWASYKEIGGIEGALAKHAKDIFAELTNNGTDAQKLKAFYRLFTRLVAPGQGQEDTRRVVDRDELGADAWSLAQELAGERNRIVVTNAAAKAAAAAHETVEVAHEALIRHWPQLREWIDRDRQFQSWLRHISPNVKAWSADPKDHGSLLRGGMLAQAREWLDTRGDDLSDAERSYIETSIGEAQKERRNIALVVGVGVAAMISLAISFWWWYRNWQYAQPWAYLADLNHSLFSDQNPSLRGDFVAIGRMDGGPIENKIFIRNRAVSRLHLFVSRNLQAIDSRSTNGTTINASFLPYGFDKKLNNGDLIALAGVAAFRFSLLPGPTKPLSPPQGAWGVLIDGRKKTPSFLTEDSYFVGVGSKGELVLDAAQNEEDPGIMKIHRGRAGGYGLMLAKNDGVRHLYVQLKDGDYEYPICQIDKLPDGTDKLCNAISKQSDPTIEAAMTGMTFCYGHWNERLGADGGVPPYSMIPYSREENETHGGVECDLGPFQIVPVNASEPQQSAGAGPAKR